MQSQSIIFHILFLSFLVQLDIAMRFANLAGLTFVEALVFWASETLVSESFSGAELGLKVRIGNAINALILCLFFSAFSWSIDYIMGRVRSLERHVDAISGDT